MENLNNRLNGIATSLQATGKAVALLAVGSMGNETERADAYSDVDFLAVVEDGAKAQLLENPEWLNANSKVAWIFRNSHEGFKLLWEDGIFGEMAVIAISELPNIPFAPGRVIWAKSGIDPEIFNKPATTGRRNLQVDVEYNQRELLTNLYVGLGRYLRGEKFSAWRFVQTHALNLALGVLESQSDNSNHPDLYTIDRRIEIRVPSSVDLIDAVVGNIQHTPKAAAVLLDWLESQGYQPDALFNEVKRLLAQC